MGDWRERIGLAQETSRQNQLRDAAERERKRLARIRAESDESDKKRAEIEEIRQYLPFQLERLGARKLLQRVRDEIWHVGEIEEREGNDDDGYPYRIYGLSFRYKTAWRAMEWDGHQDIATGPAEIGEVETYLFIKADTFNNLPGREVYIRVMDRGKGVVDQTKPVTGADKYKDIDDTMYSDTLSRKDAPQILEELILRTCIHRTLSHTLPLQLKEIGLSIINDQVPWYKRLFQNL